MRIRDTAGLLAAIPAALGFVPSESVVVMPLVAGGAVALTMRADIDEEAASLERAALLAIERAPGARAVVIVAYSSRLPAQDAAQLVRGLALAIETAYLDDDEPVSVQSMVVVGAESYAEVSGWDTALQPRPLSDVENHAVSVRAIVDGAAVRPSRAALAAQIAPESETAPEGFLEALTAPVSVSEMRTILDGVWDGDMSTNSMGWLVTVASHGVGFGYALSRLSPSTASRWFDLWSRICRVVPRERAVRPLVLAGLAAWLRGDGATLNVAGELAAQVRPDDDGVRLLQLISRVALPPDAWEHYRATLTDAA